MMLILMLIIHLLKILIYFFDTCIIFTSLSSHSARRLGAVLLYIQCVCFPAGFGLFMLWSVFVLQAFANFGESGM